MEEKSSFSLGVTYRPRHRAGTHAGHFSLAGLDFGAVSDELDHIADLGCDTLRLCLRWEEIQPSRERIGGAALRTLERVLNLAHDRRLRVAAVLFAGAMGGALQLPHWATGIPLGRESALTRHFGPPLATVVTVTAPVLFDGRYHTTPVRDIYRDSQQVAALRYQVAEVIGYFGDHPAVWSWQLGYELERARLPDSTERAYEWLASLADYARERGARHMLGATTTFALTRRETLRPEQLAELCDGVLVHTWPQQPLAVTEPWRAGYVLFLHALVAALASKPVLAAELALPTGPAEQRGWVNESRIGQPTRTYLADEEQQALFFEEALTGLYRAGAAGAWLAAYTDVPQDQWAIAPLDRVISERTLGLVREDGREKQAARTVRAFAARLRSGDLGPAGTPPSLGLDPEQYWRAPAKELRRLWEEWRQGA